jgi:hypothetical protein
MRHYMASLEKLLARDEKIYWPGHGGPVKEPRRFVRALLQHRRARETAILSRIEARRFPRSSPMSTRASTRRLPTGPPHRSALTPRISSGEGSSGPKERARLAPSIDRPEPIALACHRNLRWFRRAHFLSTTASSAASKLAILRGLAPKS